MHGHARSPSSASLLRPPRATSAAVGVAGGFARSESENVQREIRRSVSGLCSAVNLHAERLHIALEELHAGSDPTVGADGQPLRHMTTSSSFGGGGSARRTTVQGSSYSEASRAGIAEGKAERARELADRLASALRASAPRVRDLFLHLFGNDPSRKVSRRDFHQAIRLLGLDASRVVIDACFDGWAVAAVSTDIIARGDAAQVPVDEIGLRDLLLRLQVANDKGTRPRWMVGGVITRNASMWN